MALMAGTSCWPRAVSEYATEGGEVGFTSRTTTPLVASARRRAVSTLAETLGMSTRSSLKRRGPPLRFQMMFGVQAPPSTCMQALSGQALGGAGLRFLRTFRAMSVTIRYRWLLIGYQIMR